MSKYTIVRRAITAEREVKERNYTKKAKKIKRDNFTRSHWGN